MTTEALQRQLDRLWTSIDVEKFFNVSPMTVHLWRKKDGLPAVVIKGDKRPSIRFVPKDVQAWARRTKRKPSLVN